MSDALRLAQERIQRFERLGGVDLSLLDQEEKHPLLAEIRSGIAHLSKAVFTFRCPMCGHKVSSDQEMEPMCTGPNCTDDHEPLVMELVR